MLSYIVRVNSATDNVRCLAKFFTRWLLFCNNSNCYNFSLNAIEKMQSLFPCVAAQQKLYTIGTVRKYVDLEQNEKSELRAQEPARQKQFSPLAPRLAPFLF
jgi:hypothetical protein